MPVLKELKLPDLELLSRRTSKWLSTVDPFEHFIKTLICRSMLKAWGALRRADCIVMPWSPLLFKPIAKPAPF